MSSFAVNSLKWVAPVTRMAHSMLPSFRTVSKVFQPKIDLEIAKGKFKVKTVSTNRELVEVLRLRYEVFHKEYQGKKSWIGLDLDAYDKVADHLIILDEMSNKVVGTYRLISSKFSNQFYSESEFEMSDFLHKQSSILELGRACIHKDYRNGQVLNLLWRGVSEYARKIGAKTVFGCTSIKTTDPVKAQAIIAHLRDRGSCLESHLVYPKKGFEMPHVGSLDQDVSIDLVKPLIPPLLEVYLRMGGRVFPRPALDRDFKCIDLLTVLNLETISEKFEKRYMQ